MFETCGTCGGLMDPEATACPHCGAEVGVPLDSVEAWQDHLTAGAQFYDARQYDQALAELSQALVKAPEPQLPQCYVARADVYLALGDHRRASDDCTQALAIDAGYLDALACRASAYGAEGRWRNAFDDHALVMRWNPSLPDDYRQFVESLVAEAMQEFDAQVQQGDPDAQLFQDRGVALALVGRHEAALQDLQTALQAQPDDAMSHFLCAQSRAALGQFAQCAEDCTKAMSLGPASADLHFSRGAAYQQLGRHADAVIDFTAAAQLEPTLIDAYFQCGVAYEAMDDDTNAIEAYARGLQADSSSVACLKGRGRLRAKHGEFGEAIDDYSNALAYETPDIASLCGRAECYLATGQTDAASADYDAVLVEDPTSTEAFCGLGKCFLRQGQFASAVAELTKALRLDVQFGRAYQLRGKAQLEASNLSAAVEDFSRALQCPDMDAELATVHYDRAAAYLAQGQHAEALADLDHAAAQMVLTAEFFERRAEATAALGQWRPALDDLSRAIRLSPTGAEKLLERQRSLHEVALAAYTEIVAQGAASAACLRDRGLSYLALRRRKEAMQDFRDALKADADDAEAHVGIAQVLAAKDKYEQAIKHLTRAIAIAGDRAQTYYHRAECYSELNSYKRAYQDFSKAIELDRNWAKLYHARGKMLIHARQYKQAAADLQQAQRLAPRDARILVSRGKLHEARRQTSEAIAACTEALRLDPACAEAYFLRGQNLRTLRDQDAAIRDFEQAIALDPRNPDAYCSRALAMVKQRHYHRAIIELTKAAGGVRFNRDFARCYEARAKIHFLIGRVEAAVADLSLVLRLKPRRHRLDRTLCSRGLAYVKLGDLEKAQKDFELAAELNAKSTTARRLLDWVKGGREEALPELREATVDVPHRVPPVVVSERTVQRDGQWNTVDLWDQWIVCDSRGVEFGPVSKATLDQWAAEGRLDYATQLLRIDRPQWLWIGEVYPEFDPKVERARREAAKKKPSLFDGEIGPPDESATDESAPDEIVKEVPTSAEFQFDGSAEPDEEDEIPEIET